MPQMEPVEGRQRASSATGPRLVTSDGEHISSPDIIMDESTDQPSAEQPMEPDSFDVTKVILDRDRLRALRNSSAAKEIAAKALGEVAINEARSHGPDHVQRVNPYDLYFEFEHNPRDFTTMHMRERVVELTRSIAARGVRKPLDVYLKDSRLYVNGGETRWRATLHALCFLNARIERIPVVVSQGENDVDRKISQYIDNDQWQFQPLEAAKLFRSAIDLGAKKEEIARRIGKPVTFVQARIRLLEMPQWLLDKVRKDDIKADTAFNDIWLASGENDEKANKMLNVAISDANHAGAPRVMPKHIRRSSGGTGRIVTASSLRDELARILKRHDREMLARAIGDSDTDRLYQLAKLAEARGRRGRRR